MAVPSPITSTPAQLKIPLFRPNLGEDELTALREIFASGWVGLGPKTAEFEKALCVYQSRRHGVGTNSATAALHLAVNALDLPEGSEILVPTVTFVSTPHAVEYNRHKVVFTDVREDDLCIDIADLEAKVTNRTRAVIPVHMGGQPCRMDQVMAIARRHGLAVIEDVANAQGGMWQGRKLGSWGDFGVLSFEAKKNMTTGDGGMLLFDEDRYLSRLRKMRWVGIDKDTWKRFADVGSMYSWHYEVDCLGYKYNMNDIAAALGLCQLRKLDAINARKRSLIGRYLSSLRGVGDIVLPPCDLKWGGYWLFIIQTDRRDELIGYLAERGITCGVHFMPSHLQPYYRARYPETRLPIAERAWRRIVTLPLYASMTHEEQDRVIGEIREFFKA